MHFKQVVSKRALNNSVFIWPNYSFFEYRTWVDLKQFLKTTFKHIFKGLCIAADVLWSLGENFRFADILEGAKRGLMLWACLAECINVFARWAWQWNATARRHIFCEEQKTSVWCRLVLKMHTFSACSQFLLFSLFSALGIKAVGIYGDSSRKVFGMATAASTHLDGGSWPDYSFKKPASLMHMNSL